MVRYHTVLSVEAIQGHQFCGYTLNRWWRNRPAKKRLAAIRTVLVDISKKKVQTWAPHSYKVDIRFYPGSMDHSRIRSCGTIEHMTTRKRRAHLEQTNLPRISWNGSCHRHHDLGKFYDNVCSYGRGTSVWNQECMITDSYRSDSFLKACRFCLHRKSPPQTFMYLLGFMTGVRLLGVIDMTRNNGVEYFAMRRQSWNILHLPKICLILLVMHDSKMKNLLQDRGISIMVIIIWSSGEMQDWKKRPFRKGYRSSALGASDKRLGVDTMSVNYIFWLWQTCLKLSV